MTLFQVTAGATVRVHSNAISYKMTNDLGVEVARDITWTGIVTEQYFYFPDGAKRRLVVNCDAPLPALRNRGIWLRDVSCEVINE